MAVDTITQNFRAFWTDASWKDFWWGLFSCPHCIGFWLSGVTYFTAAAVGVVDNQHGLSHIINWWAVAGLQSIFASVDRYLSA